MRLPPRALGCHKKCKCTSFCGTWNNPFLLEIVNFKTEKKQKIETFLEQEKHKLIYMEKFVVKKKQKNFDL